MHLGIHGYYGYKNFGDELLLLGLIDFYIKEYNQIKKITIFCQDSAFLTDRMTTNCIHTHDIEILCIQDTFVQRIKYSPDLIVFGGGEVLTGARGVLQSGIFTYIKRFPVHVLLGKYHLYGGIGVISGLLQYFSSFFLGHAKKVYVRDKDSYRLAKTYSSEAYPSPDGGVMYILKYFQSSLGWKKVISKIFPSINTDTYIGYILLNTTGSKLVPFLKELPEQLNKDYPSDKRLYIYFPATVGSDDSDKQYYDVIRKQFPSTLLYNWSFRDVDTSLNLLANASFGCVARLHISLPLFLFGITRKIFPYQHKIQKLIRGDFFGVDTNS